jgi:hypothetical protein
MEIKNGIIKDGIIYESKESILDSCNGCSISGTDMCKKEKPCLLFGERNILTKVGKVSQILTCDNEYAYLYVSHQSDILKFPNEIDPPGYERDYYEGDFVFKEGCGFTKYRIKSEEFSISYRLDCGNRTTITTLDICLQNLPDEKYADIIQNINGEDLVLLLEFRDMYCVYSSGYRNEVCIYRIDQKLHLKVETIIWFYMPYLKSGKVEIIREVL